MSEPPLSPATRALLCAAKDDAPAVGARAKVWSTVASTVGSAAGAGAVGAIGAATTPPGGLVSGGASASKMLAWGTLLGGAVTVGLGALLLRIGPALENVPLSSTVPSVFAVARTNVPLAPDELLSRAVVAAAAHPIAAQPPLLPGSATDAPPGIVFRLLPRRSPPPAVAAVVSLPAHGAATSRPANNDALGREASLVAQAHAALLGGNPHAALRAIRAARLLPSHVLEPEELSVEAQALRGLGHDDQARGVDSTLKREFPESALAR